MNEYIRKQLDSVNGLDEKTVLKDVLETVFLQLYKHGKEEYAKLENRVLDEIKVDRELYTVFSAIIEQNRIDDSHTFLRPMIWICFQPV